MRILVTGHRGYLGSVLTNVLRHARFEAVGLDSDLYGNCNFGRVENVVESFDIDVRDVEFTELLSFDAVIHLAALSDDATGNLDPKLTEQVNHEATIRLAECCKLAGVSRFLFASSCSVYGRGGCDLLTEASPVQPLSHYAASKLRCERDLAKLADDRFSPVFLRLPTAYGVSPRLRLDLVVNDFVGAAITQGRIHMRTAGLAWRPFMHVEDIARVYAALLLANQAKVHNQVFNVVPPNENYRIADIAEAVTESVVDTAWQASHETMDRRTYRVDGSKLWKALPDLPVRWNVSAGIRQLRSAMLSTGLTPGDWRSDRYRRAPRLARLIEHGRPKPSPGRNRRTKLDPQRLRSCAAGKHV